MNRAACLAALMLLLAGCTEEAGVPGERGGTAAGEVQGGTISDAMIPLEQLNSQAPLAPRQAQGDIPADLDAEQPLVTPFEGVEGSEGTAPSGAPGDVAPPVAPTAEAVQ
ncbi:MAG: hypothetical protein ACK4RT_08765 [Erythrobacter sp.]